MNKIIPVTKKLLKKEFDAIANPVLDMERALYTKPERWDSDSHEEGIEAFREVYSLPFARRFGAYVGRQVGRLMVGFAMTMPVGVARTQFVEDDERPTDKFDLIPPTEDKQQYLWVLDVKKGWQRRGVGTSLLDKVVETAQKRGAQILYAYFREPRDSFLGRECDLITPVENYADTGKTYYLGRMRL